MKMKTKYHRTATILGWATLFAVTVHLAGIVITDSSGGSLDSVFHLATFLAASMTALRWMEAREYVVIENLLQQQREQREFAKKYNQLN